MTSAINSIQRELERSQEVASLLGSALELHRQSSQLLERAAQDYSARSWQSIMLNVLAEELRECARDIRVYADQLFAQPLSSDTTSSVYQR